jgi:hypothetical protein
VVDRDRAGRARIGRRLNALRSGHVDRRGRLHLLAEALELGVDLHEQSLARACRLLARVHEAAKQLTNGAVPLRNEGLEVTLMPGRTHVRSRHR